ncbi:hypothetical protein C8Q75DRAFT_805424 [Abortiporus biennis]|nr:hypothetical protein C8Q75DRAFT_805424 [Abortiporus biennis]
MSRSTELIRPPPDHDTEDASSTAAFAEAINARFTRSGNAAALIPLSPNVEKSTLSFPSPPISSLSAHPLSPTSMAISPLPPSAFLVVSVSSLQDILNDPEALILDIRPHNAFVIARLPNALSLSVPSTLLKRPNFSLARLAQMLPTASSRTRFSQWQTTSKILVYDSDSATLAEGGNLLGLMRKCRNEGFPQDRQVAWLKGGFQAVWRERSDLVDRKPPPHEDEEEDDFSMKKTMSAPAGLPTFAPSAPALRTKHLPASAFTFSSTTSLRTSTSVLRKTELTATMIPPTPMFPRADPFSTHVPTGSSNISQPPFSLRLPPAAMGNVSLPGVKEDVVAEVPSTPRAVPDKHAFPHLTDSSSLLTLSPASNMYGAPSHHHHHSLPPAPARPMAFNPFFDNIRQNLELSRGAGASDERNKSSGIPLKLPRRVRRRVGELPFEWLRGIARKSGKTRGASDETDDDIESVTSSSDEMVSESELSKSAPVISGSIPVNMPRRRKTSTTKSSRSTSPSNSSAEDLTHALANQFYKIELGEQRRLMDVMEHHTKESGFIVSGPSHLMGKSNSSMSYNAAMAANLGVFTGANRSASYSGTGSTSMAVNQSTTNTPRESARPSSPDKKKRFKNTQQSSPSTVFPFSITAGVEKGIKNRYRNIWPFEHARVRLLRRKNANDDDYMNASYVQPLGTTKRYIATQGPLSATFSDFWTLCWEQNVHVIVMLTREVESATEKCGNYWVDGQYGPLKLKLLETNDTPERERRRRESEMSSGFFNVTPVKSQSRRSHQKGKHAAEDSGPDDSNADQTIRRVFELRHADYPDVPPRIITQFQYLDWPDLNVPDNPRGLLNLMREVEEVVESCRKEGEKKWGEGPLRRTWVKPESRNATSVAGTGDINVDSSAHSDEVDPSSGIAKHAINNAPVLLHCSAGVGRTGGFIAVDAVLDGIRREMRKRRETRTSVSPPPPVTAGGDTSPSPKGLTSESRSSSREAMDVDSRSSPPRVDSSVDLTSESIGRSSCLTLPMSIGPNEVHVPVAGFSAMVSVPMEVDDSRPTSPTRPGVNRVNGIKASPDLVKEVKRATLLNRMVSQSHTVKTGNIPAPHFTASVDSDASATFSNEHRSPSKSTSGSASLSHSGSGSGSRAGSGQFSGSAIPSQSGSLTSLSTAIKEVSMGQEKEKLVSPSLHPLPIDQRDAKIITDLTDNGIEPNLGLDIPQSESFEGKDQASRLDTWRTEVRDSQTRASDADSVQQSSKPAPSTASSKPEQSDESPDSSEQSESRQLTVDYNQPRPLHDDKSPPLLSAYDEPIRRVVEDMREQRMSLCQSLRQYVFVHRAVIEGALMIIDEEKKSQGKGGERGARSDLGNSAVESSEGEMQTSEREPPDIAPSQPSVTTEDRHALQPSFPFNDLTLPAPMSSPAKHITTSGLDLLEPQQSPGRAKRGASPTELVKEGMEGEVLLMKRPSIKRKHRTSSDEEERLKFDPMVLSSSVPPDDR